MGGKYWRACAGDITDEVVELLVGEVEQCSFWRAFAGRCAGGVGLVPVVRLGKRTARGAAVSEGEGEGK